MENVATYSDSRTEYTKQLAMFIVPSLVAWFQQTWHRNAHNRQQCLALFQSECEEVARWNADRIHDEVRVLIERTGCDYMEELMTAVFVAYTKVMTAVRLSNREKKLSISVPKLDHFIHRIFREAARSFWKSAFLFMETGSVLERQKNLLQIEALATEAIGMAVRSLLPVKQILRDCMEGGEHEEIEDETVSAGVGAAAPAASALPEEKPAPLPEPEKPAPPAPQEEKPAPEPEKPAQPPASQPPAVVNIDTEPSVTFAAYDDVYDESADGPALHWKPKDVEEENEFGGIQINESSARSLSAMDDDDFVDLEPVAKAPAPPMSDKIMDDVIEL